MGNAFLSHIKAVDGIFHLVRLFENADVTHVEGSVDPLRDLEIINTELRAKDLQFMESQVTAMEKVVRQIDKTKKGDLDVLLKVQAWLQVPRPSWGSALFGPHRRRYRMARTCAMVSGRPLKSPLSTHSFC